MADVKARLTAEGAEDTEEIKTALLGSPFANRFVIGW